MVVNFANDGLVVSTQTDIHPRLQEFLQRHLDTRWSQPLHKPSVEAYWRLRDEVRFSDDRPFILDSGCGTGKSTRQLARTFPDHIVIGVDQSQARLAKSGLNGNFMQNRNWILLRAELTTFWRLLAKDKLVPESHFLLYPNPWPKSNQMKRRWHGHPVFPVLLGLGGTIEMRCNWDIYALEFAYASSLASGRPIKSVPYQPGCSASPFEQKYLQRGQQLYSVTVPPSVTQAFRYFREKNQ